MLIVGLVFHAHLYTMPSLQPNLHENPLSGLRRVVLTKFQNYFMGCFPLKAWGNNFIPSGTSALNL